jgi:hypothetical protein
MSDTNNLFRIRAQMDANGAARLVTGGFAR